MKDANQLDELLKIQLEQNRTEWERTRQRYRTYRSLSFFFLFLVIAGGLMAFFYVLTRLQH